MLMLLLSTNRNNGAVDIITSLDQSNCVFIEAMDAITEDNAHHLWTKR